MRLIYEYDWDEQITYSVEEAVQKELEPLLDDGLAERAIDTANNAASMLKDVIVLLHTKGVLQNADILSLLGCVWEEVE